MSFEKVLKSNAPLNAATLWVESGGGWCKACLFHGGEDGVKNLMSRLILTEDPASTSPAKPTLLTLSHKHACMRTRHVRVSRVCVCVCATYSQKSGNLGSILQFKSRSNERFGILTFLMKEDENCNTLFYFFLGPFRFSKQKKIKTILHFYHLQ